MASIKRGTTSQRYPLERRTARGSRAHSWAVGGNSSGAAQPSGHYRLELSFKRATIWPSNGSRQASIMHARTNTAAAYGPKRGLSVRCQGSAPAGTAGGRAPWTKAVVIGAGLAGLAAAKALSSHFKSVVVLERDAWKGDSNDGRPGVAQFPQPHVLLYRGLQALDNLFGGYSQALREAGGEPVDFTEDFFFYDYGFVFTRGPSELKGVLGTRSLMERTARALVVAQEGITLKAGAVVTGLQFDEAGKQVTGVQLKDGSVEEADLVVDVSGRTSHAADWLEAAGFQRPPTMWVDGKLAYATRTYERPKGYSGPKAAFVMGHPADGEPGPGSTRGGIMIPVENDRWQLVLSGYADDHPPTDEDGFQAFMESLQHPFISDVLKESKPLTPISRFANTRNVRRQYEKVDMPEGFMVLGDAMCSFNPIYGQGITVGSMQAEALRALLDERRAAAGGNLRTALKGLPNEFQRRAASDVVSLPWEMAISEDSKWEVAEASYKVPQTTHLLRPYFQALAGATSKDLAVFTEWARVIHMAKPATAMFSWFMIRNTLWYSVLRPLLARLPIIGRRWRQADMPGLPAASDMVSAVQS